MSDSLRKIGRISWEDAFLWRKAAKVFFSTHSLLARLGIIYYYYLFWIKNGQSHLWHAESCLPILCRTYSLFVSLLYPHTIAAAAAVTHRSFQILRNASLGQMSPSDQTPRKICNRSLSVDQMPVFFQTGPLGPRKNPTNHRWGLPITYDDGKEYLACRQRGTSKTSGTEGKRCRAHDRPDAEI